MKTATERKRRAVQPKSETTPMCLPANLEPERYSCWIPRYHGAAESRVEELPDLDQHVKE